MTDVRDVLDTLDLALARSDGILDDATTQPMAQLAHRLRIRHGFVGEVLVVALAGGTGSGKSSIVNALVGEEIVPTGVVRPTTQHATAVTSAATATDFTSLFDSVGVDHHLTNEAADDLALIDLPDFDSTAEAHRHVVEHVVPRVDAVVWVLDPEKYADPVLHRGFLASMADHEDQFIFVLNQADRLGDDVGVAVDALDGLIRDDGFRSPSIVATRAQPFATADVGALTAAIEGRWDVKATALAKLGLDLRIVAAEGWRAVDAIDPGARGDRGRDAIALAKATFVSLGVAAFELHHRYANRP